MTLSTEEKGYSTELFVAAKLIRLGFNVSNPLAPYRYDLVIEKEGKFQRIQIKYSDSFKERETETIRFIIFRKGLSTNYSKDFDILVLVSEKSWWIIPANIVDGKKELSITNGGKYEKYRNAFLLLG